ncbi:DUF1304 family protein [Modestobacter sp. I12A-02628]|uniref:DUF1304 domain-containing protein n=1 Tax=Goekera deserti TaxID=2497753 RepID=A0A7K3WE55_9ACTN|nr:DUF1304 domain-containing protein [Goekera deserti]MPQ99707.1 DUF1304 family protein [Goekera deserti]NDI46283.1 DUF1304 family protein [Goekera deserti]NEL54785.1 DUF1304 domain-containing protein [Goekera deserti]
MLTLALVLAALAGALHVVIFVMESFLWRTPRVRAAFAVASEQDAEATAEMAYNQGFYNLFLGIGALVGVGLVAGGAGSSAQEAAGWALVVSSCASMLAAALVLVTTHAKYRAAAAKQGTFPALALLCALVGALT